MGVIASRGCRGAVGLALAFAAPAYATASTVAPVAPAAVPASPAIVPGAPAASVADCRCRVVPALTPVVLEIMVPLGSRTSKTGEMFAIRLAKPVWLNGVELLPAGLTGMGEVVHAKPSGGGGGGGELVLAARYLDAPTGRVRLRSMQASTVGKDQTGLAMATAYAVGIFAMAVKGKNTELPAGTLADAKIAQDFAYPLDAAGAAPAAVATATISTP